MKNLISPEGIYATGESKKVLAGDVFYESDNVLLLDRALNQLFGFEDFYGIDFNCDVNMNALLFEFLNGIIGVESIVIFDNNDEIDNMMDECINNGKSLYAFSIPKYNFIIGIIGYSDYEDYCDPPKTKKIK